MITRDVDGAEMVVAAGNHLNYDATLMAGKIWASGELVSLSFTTEGKRGLDAWDSLSVPFARAGLRPVSWTGPAFSGSLKGNTENFPHR